MKLSGVVMFILMTAACTKGEDRAGPQAKPTGNEADVSAGPAASAAGAAASGPAKPADPLGDAERLLAGWLAAQNQPNASFDAYIAYYDPSFAGIKRTRDGDEKQFDLAAWTADRRKMFETGWQKVAADEVSTALRVKSGDVEVTFVQRWAAGVAGNTEARYADHGTKVLLLRRDAAGALKIVREELRSSRPGWEDAADEPKTLDATDLVPPLAIEVTTIAGDSRQECRQNQIHVAVTDGKGTRRSVLAGSVSEGGFDAATEGKTYRVKPRKNGARLYQIDGLYCAGLEVGLALVREGDTLVAIETWQDEESGPGTDRRVAVRLPPGAELEPR